MSKSDNLLYGDELDNNQLFVAVAWFNEVGIVCTFDKFEGSYNCYIKSVGGGNTPRDDVQLIASYGSRFPLESFMVMNKHIDFRLNVFEEVKSCD